ncbi:MAG: ribonuclease P protein component [Planctomycetes bacterium]|nr:ribonuclease P protein component [Planctomycetota bacterium]
MNPCEESEKGVPDKAPGGGFRFPQAARLKIKREFDQVFKKGVKGVNHALVLYLLPNDVKRNRLGLAVGKKVGNAVRRNRVKRMIREAFRLENPRIPSGFDMVCIPRAPGFPEKTTDLIPLFQEAFMRAYKRIQGRKGRT